MTLRKFSLTLALAALVALAVPTIALANFAIHGNYVSDTDACAGCHRAHTAVSTITWSQVGGAGESSALLISTATKMEDFCYACHDGNSLGADTNVMDGIYLGDQYGTQDAVLNGGGIDNIAGAPVTSKHMVNGASWGAYGGGYYGDTATDTATDGSQGIDPTTGGIRNLGMSTNVKMDCATCHDPHGSPNYRILKSVVNGNYVGGYQDSGVPEDPDPDGYVSSVETGWPAGGFRLHNPGGYPDYQPSYTTPRYAKGYNQRTGALDTTRGMTGWCSGCHSVYSLPRTLQTKSSGATYTASASVYNAGDVITPADGSVWDGMQLRHRHPMNVPLSNYSGPDKTAMVISTNPLPLAHSLEESSTGPTQESSDWIECLTCHRAHGTAATMTGWANEKSALPGDEVPDFISRNSGGDGSNVPSALLRGNNRYVCEACHNK